MERGCLTFTTASSTPPRPAAAVFLRRRAPSFRQSHDRCQQLFRISTANYSSISQNSSSSKSKGSLFVKALNQSLSSEWDVSNYAAPSWLPRFEELDTTNMLLRQRIIFLGSQVFSISFFLLMNSKFWNGFCALFVMFNLLLFGWFANFFWFYPFFLA